MPLPEYVSRSQLAEILQITPQQVWRLTKAGELSPNLGDGKGQAAAA